MRILLLNYEFPPLGGGAANATFQVLTEIARVSDVMIDVVVSSTGAARVEQFSHHITVHFLDIHKKGSLHHQTNIDLLRYSIAAHRKCRELTAQYAYDGIHAFFGIPCGYIAAKLGLPYIISLRGSDVPFYNTKYWWLDRLFFARMSKRLWKHAARVTATSEGLKESALKVSPSQPIIVIRNGVHVDSFAPQQKPAGPFTIISASRLTERKGITYVIEAFRVFAQTHADVRLLIAGEGDALHTLQLQAKNSGVMDRISFLGAVPHAEMVQQYHASDVFVLPSMNEGMSNALLEAMSAGLAVVATDTGDAKFLIQGGGKIVPKRDAASIAEFFEYAYTHPEELRAMKKHNREQVAGMSWTTVAQQTLHMYDDVFSGKGRGSSSHA